MTPPVSNMGELYEIIVQLGKGVQSGGMKALPTERSSRRWVIGSLVCAVLAVFVAPVVFGPLGIVAGSVAVAKGERWWGMLGVSGSAVAAVAGYWWAGGLVG